MKQLADNQTVLVSVLKNPRDLEILLTEHCYRIPVHYAPKKPFTYIAFYQPASFKDHGKRIEYYARPIKRETKKRIELVPSQPNHPAAQTDYYKYSFEKILELAEPVRNIIPRRVTFGYTTLERLQNAHDMLELYDVAPIEQMIAAGLRQADIPVTTELPIGYSSGRFRIDLALACRAGMLAIECDNTSSHRTAAQKEKDQHKDMVLKYHGWRVVRLSETEVLNHFDRSLGRVQMAIASLGGLSQK